MNEVVRFFECMEEVIAEHPEIFFKIERLRSNGWWRIHIFGKDLGTYGDAEVLFREDSSRQQAFEKALRDIEQMKINIRNLKERKNERSIRSM